MPARLIYLDNHATTRVDPRVVAAMVPFFEHDFGNPASTTHGPGRDARDAVDRARAQIAAAILAAPDEIVFTSGATESNNLAIQGVMKHRRRRGNHLVTLATEHKAVLDPCQHLARGGIQLAVIPVEPAAAPLPGQVALAALKDALTDETGLVSVMLANNEHGGLQPIAEIAAICHERGIPLHCDATQAVGRMPVDVQALDVDLLSFSAHKFYGPKGVGALYVRRRPRLIRLEPLQFGGGHEMGLRSGTLNVPGIVGMASGLELCLAEMSVESERLAELRNRLWQGLNRQLDGVILNGPPLDLNARLPGNLNCQFAGIEGESLLLKVPHLALSSGSACTSAQPQPSHVLRALGLSDAKVRSSIRFGLGRFNDTDQIDFAVAQLVQAVRTLRGTLQ